MGEEHGSERGSEIRAAWKSRAKLSLLLWKGGKG